MRAAISFNSWFSIQNLQIASQVIILLLSIIMVARNDAGVMGMNSDLGLFHSER